MLDPEPTILDPRIRGVADEVEAWRLRQLLDAGYQLDQAERLAVRVDIDLHRALELVDRGCPPAVAARILL